MEFKLERRETVFLRPAGELMVERHELATQNWKLFVLARLRTAIPRYNVV